MGFVEDKQLIESTYDAIFNKVAGTLPKPTLIITKTNKNDRCARLSNDEGTYTFKLDVSLKRNPTSLVVRILDSIIKLKALVDNIRVTSREGYYNNTKYVEVAYELGIPCITRSNGSGCCVNSHSVFVNDLVQELFGIKCTKDNVENLESEGRKSSTRKYVCPKCGKSVRATRVVNILCGDCHVKMVSNRDIIQKEEPILGRVVVGGLLEKLIRVVNEEDNSSNAEGTILRFGKSHDKEVDTSIDNLLAVIEDSPDAKLIDALGVVYKYATGGSAERKAWLTKMLLALKDYYENGNHQEDLGEAPVVKEPLTKKELGSSHKDINAECIVVDPDCSMGAASFDSLVSRMTGELTQPDQKIVAYLEGTAPKRKGAEEYLAGNKPKKPKVDKEIKGKKGSKAKKLAEKPAKKSSKESVKEPVVEESVVKEPKEEPVKEPVILQRVKPVSCSANSLVDGAMAGVWPLLYDIADGNRARITVILRKVGKSCVTTQDILNWVHSELIEKIVKTPNKLCALNFGDYNYLVSRYVDGADFEDIEKKAHVIPGTIKSRVDEMRGRVAVYISKKYKSEYADEKEYVQGMLAMRKNSLVDALPENSKLAQTLRECFDKGFSEAVWGSGAVNMSGDVFTLYYDYGFSEQEISLILKEPVASVKTQLADIASRLLTIGGINNES